ncbi:hypothetical protein BDQ12DRAFT_708947 [Crucibulum laeve]|uniref:Uncharacterized protein n=1 Tax=Crucibulum laeve TaxID=68775 RepID=A0A5C3MDT8_9AGAR|nr:hypothetical protein BDQ12DRAFT_708947 [Crucibulum laeve]
MRCTWSTLARHASRAVQHQPHFHSINSKYRLSIPSFLLRSPLHRQYRALHQALPHTPTTPSESLLPISSPTTASHRFRTAFLAAQSRISETRAGSNVCQPLPTCRLTGHTVVHTYIRAGMAREALDLCYKMNKLCGFHIQSKTLEAVIRALEKSGHKIRAMNLQSVGEHESTFLHSRSCKDPSIRALVHLLVTNNNERSRRTDAMFKMLISLCIINGEIIAASLIFGFLAKNWKKKQALEAHLDAVLEERLLPPDSEQSFIQDRNNRRKEALFPHREYMYTTLRVIEKTLSAERHDDTHYVSVSACAQTVANFAGMLARREIPFSEISFLIKTMYNSRNMGHTVYIRGWNDGVKKRSLSHYLDQVLEELLHTLPSTDPVPPRESLPHVHQKKVKGCEGMLPPLDAHSYNTLLYYALVVRKSEKLGTVVLNHMTQKRHVPLQPDTTTGNILIQAGQVLNRPDITELATKAFQLTQRREEGKAASSELGLLPDLKRDIRTLTNYLVTVVETKPRDILPIVQHTMAGLHPKDSGPNIEGSDEFLKERRYKQLLALARAAKLGPYIMTIFLEGLQRATDIASLEWLWFWAKRAAQMSWHRDPSTGIKPWALPVHAYAIVIKGYATAPPYPFGRIPKHDGTEVNTKIMRYHLPWVRFEKKRAFLKRRHRKYGTLLRRIRQLKQKSMFAACRGVYADFKKMRALQATNGIPAPKADSALFNAIFRVIPTRPALMHRYKKRRTPSFRHRSRLPRRPRRERAKIRHYAFFEEVFQDLIDTGYEVPPAFRKLFSICMGAERLEHRWLRSPRGPYLFRRKSYVRSRGFVQPMRDRVPYKSKRYELRTSGYVSQLEWVR